MPVRSVCTYWALYNDKFTRVRLLAEPGVHRIAASNDQLSAFMRPPGSLDKIVPHSFFPLSLGAGVGNASPISATMTGGRTFLLSRASSKLLGFPSSLCLDLSKLGWGDGLLEVRAEVKGAGTLFNRTRLSKKRLAEILRKYPDQEKQHLQAVAQRQFPLLLSSRAEFMGRHMGGQSQRFAVHAVRASSVLLAKSLIKFVPVWNAVSQSEQVVTNLDIVSEALAAGEMLFRGESTCEIRFTPSTIRAVYFDNARDNKELGILCSYVSQDCEELGATLEEMVRDARRYLEIIARTTFPCVGGGFTWIKVGDVNEVFGKPEENSFRKQRQSAWFFAKDEVIVRKAGKFFTDMESYFGKDVGFHSISEFSLCQHHGLYILSVLRDHLRVCTQFAIGTEVLRSGGDLSRREEGLLRRHIFDRIVKSINHSPFLQLTPCGELIILKVKYEHVQNLEESYEIPLDQLPAL